MQVRKMTDCQSQINQQQFASAQLVSSWMPQPEGLGQRHKKRRWKPGRFLLQSTCENRFQWG